MFKHRVSNITKGLTYKQRVVAFVMATSLVAVIATSLPMAVNTVNENYQDIIEDSRVKARLLGGMAAAGVYFEQEEAVKRALDSSAADDTILYVAAFRKSELSGSLEVMAVRNPAEFPPPYQIVSFEPKVVSDKGFLDYIELTHPIELDGEFIGYLQLRSSLAEIKQSVTRQLFFMAVAITLSMILALGLANLIKGSLTKPIEVLTDLTIKVGKTKDYTLQASVETDDEIGTLAKQFNQMLVELSKSDELRLKNEKEILILNDELEAKVMARTQELEHSNQTLVSTIENLKLTQQQLVEQEKMASLGSLVAGIAHEVNTPIGIGVTAASHQRDIIDTLKAQFESGKLTKQTFSTNVEGLFESSQIIFSNLNRAAELIRSFKLVAVDQSSEQARLFDLHEYIQDVVRSLKPKFKQYSVELKIEMPPTFQIFSFPGVFSQIFTNFIVNSLTHGFDPGEDGEIVIEIKEQDDQLIIDYRDTGKGIAEGIRSNIFDPFVTTARGKGGSGLGTYIVYNHVTQTLKGNITCIDVPAGEGARFLITVPMQSLRA